MSDILQNNKISVPYHSSYRYLLELGVVGSGLLNKILNSVFHVVMDSMIGI